MELIKDVWKRENIKEFQEFLISCGRPEKVQWTTNIINTKMPVLAILSPVVKDITKKIAKGNYMSFLDLWIWEYMENTSIIGGLISQIKDFDVMEKYLTRYAECSDNWATCDLITFKVNDKNKDLWWDLSQKYIKSDKPFVKRIGINIWFKLIEVDGFLPRIFDSINKFGNEKEYYVNMVIAWLLAECFTKRRDETLEYYKSNTLNAFAINKSISKCRDSFRISKEDKDMLLQYKK